MNIAIVDDLNEERENIKKLLLSYAETNKQEFNIQEFSSAEELLADYQPLLYTVIFLDIFMDGQTGLSAAEQIRRSDTDTFLVFLTTSAEHLSDAFMARAFDYILKPADPGRVFRVMDDILKRTLADEKRLSFSCNREDYSLSYSDIMAVCTSDHYLVITDRRGTSYTTRMTFSTISDLLLQDSRFLTIIRGVLVNMEYIIDLKGGTCHMEHDLHLAYGLRQEKKLIHIWQNYMFAKLRKEAMERGKRS